jgi:hypothetical protein
MINDRAKQFLLACIKNFNNLISYSNYIPDKTFFAIATAWIAVMFLFYAFFIFDDNLSLAIIAIDAYPDFSNKASWLPLAIEVSKGRLFPITTTLSPALDSFSFYPYLSIWILGLLIALIGTSKALLLGQVFFPTIAFYLCALSYRIWLPRGWAIILAALGSIAYVDYPLRDFLFELLSGADWNELGTKFRPDLTNVPFPAISAVAFTGMFYLTFNNQRLSKQKIVLLSIGWALQTQIHIVNAIFGIPFWICYLFLRLYRQKRLDQINTLEIFKIWLFQLFLITLIAFPSVGLWLEWFNFESDSANFFSQLALHANSKTLFTYQSIAYFIFPVCITALISIARRIDPFELFTRFWPVYLLMIIEIFIVFVAPPLFNLNWIAELTFSRIAMFFLHMLYYVPPIYFAVRPQLEIEYTFGFEANNVSSLLRTLLNWFFHTASRVYLPLIFMVLSLFLVLSARNSKNFYISERIPAVKFIEDRLILLQSQNILPGALVADTNLAINFNLHLLGYSSLLNNRFVNKLSIQDCLERIVLYSLLAGWSEDDLVDFMTPPKNWFENHSNVIINLTSLNPPKGVGYWLIFNQRELPELEFHILIAKTRATYKNMNVLEVANRMGLKYIILNDTSPSKSQTRLNLETSTIKVYPLNVHPK